MSSVCVSPGPGAPPAAPWGVGVCGRFIWLKLNIGGQALLPSALSATRAAVSWLELLTPLLRLPLLLTKVQAPAHQLHCKPDPS